MIEKLDKTQKERASRLEQSLLVVAQKGDLTKAKAIVADLQQIYLPKGQSAKLMMAKNRLFEAAMESGELNYAEIGLIGVRQKVNSSTRVYLEASSLLAILYLRRSEIDKAEPIIQEVLSNDNVIKSQARREEFRKLIIERFDQEGTLYAIRIDNVNKLDPKEIQDEAGKEVALSKTENELLEQIGNEVPKYAINILHRIDSFSKKMLPSAERLKLPPPAKQIEPVEVGKTLFKSIKRVLHKSLCDKDSEIYKAWYSQGMGAVLNKYSIGIVISESFLNLGIGLRAIAIPVAALIIKFGIEVYCEQYASKNIMEIR